MTSQLLTGWGRTMPSRAEVVAPLDAAHLSDLVRAAGPRGVLARGAGRSYGDAAQNGGGTVLDLSSFSTVSLLDDGDVVAGAGVLLADLIEPLLGVGRFLPVTPGTRWVTVGGMVAADVHGKNHHADGSFGHHVRELELVTADGTVRRLRAEGDQQERRLLDATLGGMGLTGVVTEVRFATIPAPSARVVVDTDRADDLDTLMALMVSGDDEARYSVAWVDGSARGRRLGRGVLTRGEHAGPGRLEGGDRGRAPDREPRLSLPAVPASPLNRASIAAFNEMWFRKAPRQRRGELVDLAPYFYPLDAVGGWNRLYGRHGFLQYQFAVPDAAGDVVRLALERLAGIGAPSFLTVLKRFGAGRPESPLSFPLRGWTLALDVPARVPGLGEVLDGLDESVVGAGGRVYLAKDSRAVPATIAASYPDLDDFRDLRASMDPRGVFVSDLSRRLQL